MGEYKIGEFQNEKDAKTFKIYLAVFIGILGVLFLAKVHIQNTHEQRERNEFNNRYENAMDELNQNIPPTRP